MPTGTEFREIASTLDAVVAALAVSLNQTRAAYALRPIQNGLVEPLVERALETVQDDLTRALNDLSMQSAEASRRAMVADQWASFDAAYSAHESAVARWRSGPQESDTYPRFRMDPPSYGRPTWVLRR